MGPFRRGVSSASVRYRDLVGSNPRLATELHDGGPLQNRLDFT
jgi:hypothetical protein